MEKYSNEKLSVYGYSLASLCRSLAIMQNINDYEGINMCQNHINKFVDTITQTGHFIEVRDFIKNVYSESYAETIDNSYAFNQSQTLLKMCNDKTNCGAQTQTTDEDILMFLSDVQQAGEIKNPIEAIEISLDGQLEDICPFEPSEENQLQQYTLIQKEYENAKQYVVIAQSLISQNGQIANTESQDSTETFNMN